MYIHIGRNVLQTKFQHSITYLVNVLHTFCMFLHSCHIFPVSPVGIFTMFRVSTNPLENFISKTEIRPENLICTYLSKSNFRFTTHGEKLFLLLQDICQYYKFSFVSDRNNLQLGIFLEPLLVNDVILSVSFTKSWKVFTYKLLKIFLLKMLQYLFGHFVFLKFVLDW